LVNQTYHRLELSVRPCPTPRKIRSVPSDCLGCLRCGCCAERECEIISMCGSWPVGAAAASGRLLRGCQHVRQLVYWDLGSAGRCSWGCPNAWQLVCWGLCCTGVDMLGPGLCGEVFVGLSELACAAVGRLRFGQCKVVRLSSKAVQMPAAQYAVVLRGVWSAGASYGACGAVCYLPPGQQLWWCMCPYGMSASCFVLHAQHCASGWSVGVET
jgi:hypothetical protein